MALESFYGGKPGISPVIRNSFKFVNTGDPAYIAKIDSNTPYSELSPKEIALLKIVNPNLNITSEGSIKWDKNYLKPFTMDECFADPNYRDVWYSELCIIDTDNKMNPNNGKIFRRTLKRTETAIGAGDTIYAEYIGQIVGPSGGVPNIFFGSIDSARKKAAGLAKTLETDGEITENNFLDVSGWDYSYPIINDNNIIEISTANITTFTPDTRSDDDQHIAILSSIHDNTLNDSQYGDNIELVPGKDQNGKFNDDIQYTWCNVRRTLTNGGREDAWIYLGFKIPYTVFDVDVQKENYRYDGDYLIDNSTTPESNTYHPFSKYYTFHIPRGTRGIGPEEIFIVTPENKDDTLGSETTLYDFDAIKYDQGNDTYSINSQKIKEFKDPNKEKTYWVAKWTLYNPEKKSEPVIYQYLGSYRDVSEITLDNDGTITINYSDGTYKEFSDNKLNWITDVTVNTDIQSENYGKFTITFNNENISNGAYNTILPLIKNAIYNPLNGLITFEHAGGPDRDVTTTNAISYVSNMKVLDDGTVQYQLNTETETETRQEQWHSITQIKDIIEAKVATSENLSKFKSIIGININENEEPIFDDNNNPIPIIIIGIDGEEISNPIVGHLYVRYRPEPDKWVDLGLVNINSTLGIVVQDILKTDDESQETETIGDWLAKLNAENGRRVIDDDSDTVILKTGEITVNGTNKTGGFVAVTDNTDSENPVTYLVYYDPHKGEWINGGTLSGDINSEYANGIYVQEQDENNQTTTIPAKNEKATFTFISENITDSETSLLTMPWEQENYGSQSNSSNNQESSNSEESNSSNSG